MVFNNYQKTGSISISLNKIALGVRKSASKINLAALFWSFTIIFIFSFEQFPNILQHNLYITIILYEIPEHPTSRNYLCECKVIWYCLFAQLGVLSISNLMYL